MEARFEAVRTRVRQALCDNDVARRGPEMGITVVSAVMNNEMASGLAGEWSAVVDKDNIVVTIVGPGASNTRLRFHVPDMTVEQGAVYAVHDL